VRTRWLDFRLLSFGPKARARQSLGRIVDIRPAEALDDLHLDIIISRLIIFRQ